ncbi:MAG: hypothetical protein E6J41_16570 [Chloroflexi bacterium]|nr:MAG: hypothetical protein E6J41_16570 [Chloroflexota bacterium]
MAAQRRTADRPTGLAALPADYGPLFDRAVAVLGGDERVRAVWLAGALARGAADAASDLDFVVAVRDDDFEPFAAAWHDWLAAISPTLVARELPGLPGSFYALTPACLRFDVVTERVSRIGASEGGARLPVLDRDGLHARLPAPAERRPDPARIAYLVEECLRQAANFPTVTVRGDWLLGVVAVQEVHLMLYQLFVEANQPSPPMGAKRWSAKLTAAQAAALAALPVPQPRRESVLEARQAALRAFLEQARPIAARCGVPWPDALEAAVRDFLRRELDLPLG